MITIQFFSSAISRIWNAYNLALVITTPIIFLYIHITQNIFNRKMKFYITYCVYKIKINWNNNMCEIDIKNTKYRIFYIKNIRIFFQTFSETLNFQIIIKITII